MTDDKLLSVFTPSRTQPKDLEAIHVQRHTLLDDAVQRVRESATSSNKHHLLFVGPRGTGKTHFVTLLVHRLGQIQELDDKLLIAWLNEDETSTTLLELLQRIYLALGKRYPKKFSDEDLEPIYDLDASQAENWLIGHLLKTLHNRTLLVVVENLDDLFSGLGEAGQQKLRAFIQEHPVLCIVATAQRLIDDLTKRKSAFFGFFQTETLKTLSATEAAALLSKIAELKQQPQLSQFLKSATGRARILALHHLAGGNHRIFIVLSQFITQDNIDALVVPFAKMVDEMTPYYQERIRWLPPQQRKIVEFLCGCERPTPVKQIARRLFASQQTISSQLKDLRSKGYVLSAQRGRESLYEIAEPLMRICVEVKENQTYAPLRILVDFLRVWYDQHELDQRLDHCKHQGLEHDYLQSAVERNKEQNNLRRQLLVNNYRTDIGDAFTPDWEQRILGYANISDALTLAFGEWKRGDSKFALKLIEDEVAAGQDLSPATYARALALQAEIQFSDGDSTAALKALTKLIEHAPPIDQLARALNSRGFTFGQLGNTTKAIGDFSRVIELENASVDQVAIALNFRGTFLGQQGDTTKAIEDFSRVIELEGAPVKQLAITLNSRGIAFEQQGDMTKAIEDYTRVIELEGATDNLLAMALNRRGAIFLQQGNSTKAIEDLSRVIELKDAPVDQLARALNSRGFAFGEWGDTSKELEDYSRVIELDGAPVDHVAAALSTRGAIFAQQGDMTKAIEHFSRVIELEEVPVNQLAITLNGRGLAFEQQGDTIKAIEDYTRVIGLDGAPVDQLARALNYRGFAYGQQGDTTKEIEDYSRVVELEGVPVDQLAVALSIRGITFEQQGDTSKAVKEYSRVIELEGVSVNQLAIILNTRAFAFEQQGDRTKAVEDYSRVIELEGIPIDQLARALNDRGLIFRQQGDFTRAAADFKAITEHPRATPGQQVDGYLALAEIHIGQREWGDVFADLESALHRGRDVQPAYTGNTKDIISALYQWVPANKKLAIRIGEIAKIYRCYEAESVLGEALIQHLGDWRNSPSEKPSVEQMGTWKKYWEEACAGMSELDLALRIFRTGIDFLKSPTEDRSILTELNQEERKILKQALGLTDD